MSARVGARGEDQDAYDAMPWEQRKRMDKMLSETHFLLDVRRDASNPQRVHFSVTGSTGNVYQLLLDLGDSPCLECDCPDFVRHAARHKVLCKHACFVLRRVLRQANDGALCYQHPRRFLVHSIRASVERETERLLRRSFERECSEIVNETYLERYRKSTKKIEPSDANNATDRVDDAGSKKRKIDAEKEALQNFGIGRRQDWSDDEAAASRLDTECCPVCFEEFKSGSEEMLVRCGVCCNFAHRACLDKWLSGGSNRNCVFCRAELAYILYTETAKRARSSTAIETYLNVADQH